MHCEYTSTTEHSSNLANPTRERAARRALARFGLRLQKTPARSWLREWHSVGYQILEGNLILAGCMSREYEMSITEVEAWIAQQA